MNTRPASSCNGKQGLGSVQMGPFDWLFQWLGLFITAVHKALAFPSKQNKYLVEGLSSFTIENKLRTGGGYNTLRRTGFHVSCFPVSGHVKRVSVCQRSLISQHIGEINVLLLS